MARLALNMRIIKVNGKVGNNVLNHQGYTFTVWKVGVKFAKSSRSRARFGNNVLNHQGYTFTVWKVGVKCAK
jgi:hypothetical protein